jgi:hypothetical protein
MKKILFVAISLLCMLLTGCEKDHWGDSDPTLEHVYFVGIRDLVGLNNNAVAVSVAQGDTTSVPLRFFSERVRSYDVVTYYYVGGTLQRGVNYEIIDQKGNILTPDANGAFALTWPKAVKGVQRVHIKTKSVGKGSFTILTSNPNAATPITSADVSTTVNNKTDQYEVRTFSQNYKATVNIN